MDDADLFHQQSPVYHAHRILGKQPRDKRGGSTDIGQVAMSDFASI